MDYSSFQLDELVNYISDEKFSEYWPIFWDISKNGSAYNEGKQSI